MLTPATLDTREEQNVLEDRHAANKDKIHVWEHGKSGGYLRKRLEQRRKTETPLMSLEEWESNQEVGCKTLNPRP